MALTPIFDYKEYNQLKKAELKTLLVERFLPFSGTKGAMVARLTEWDYQHPFPFMQLPILVRNQIYRDVAVDQKTRVFKVPGKSLEVSPPQLFRTSHQIRTEGLPIFYQYHLFHIPMTDEGFRGIVLKKRHIVFNMNNDQGYGEISLKGIHQWLKRLDPNLRLNIRNLEIPGQFFASDKSVMDLINAELSSEATVAYKCVTPYYETRELQELYRKFLGDSHRDAPTHNVGRPYLPRGADCQLVDEKLTFRPRGFPWFAQGSFTYNTTNAQKGGSKRISRKVTIKEEVSEEEVSRKVTVKKEESEEEASPKVTVKKEEIAESGSKANPVELSDYSEDSEDSEDSEYSEYSAAGNNPVLPSYYPQTAEDFERLAADQRKIDILPHDEFF